MYEKPHRARLRTPSPHNGHPCYLFKVLRLRVFTLQLTTKKVKSELRIVVVWTFQSGVYISLGYRFEIELYGGFVGYPSVSGRTSFPWQYQANFVAWYVDHAEAVTTQLTRIWADPKFLNQVGNSVAFRPIIPCVCAEWLLVIKGIIKQSIKTITQGRDTISHLGNISESQK